MRSSKLSRSNAQNVGSELYAKTRTNTRLSRQPGLVHKLGFLHSLFLAVLTATLLTFAGVAQAKSDAIYTSFLNNKAAGGYDVVSYFDGSAPVEGNADYQTTYNGADWLFSSQENLDAFLASPEKYAPQYGGYCAYAAASGSTAKGDPLQYSLENGKLYLNYNASIKERWLANKVEFIEQADSNWPKLLD